MKLFILLTVAVTTLVLGIACSQSNAPLKVTEIWGEFHPSFGGLVHFELVATDTAEAGMECNVRMWSGSQSYADHDIVINPGHLRTGNPIVLDFEVGPLDKIVAQAYDLDREMEDIVEAKIKCNPAAPPTITPKPTHTLTPAPTPTQMPTPTPTLTPIPTPTPTPTPIPTPTKNPADYVEVLAYNSSVVLGPGAKESCGAKDHSEKIELQRSDTLRIDVSSARELNLYIYPPEGDEQYRKGPKTTLRDTYHALQDGRYLLRIESSWNKGFGSCNEALTSVDFEYRVDRLRD